jgi:GST-like protein
MMIELYSWATPNGHKIHIMLEEAGIPYRVHGVNIRTGEQFKPDFLKISPNNRIPALVDPDGPGNKPLSLFESGAILLYLASKTGKFLPEDVAQRWSCMQWLMWQMGGVGPMFGQVHHFLRAAKEPVPYAIERYVAETRRLYTVLDTHLAKNEWLAGGEYTIAEMATYPWIARHEWHKTDLNDFPNVKRWYDRISARPAVQRGMAIPKI